MEAKDAKGRPLAVGDSILIRARIINIAPAGGDVFLVALTEVPHGTEGRRSSIHTIHGSQVEKVTT